MDFTVTIEDMLMRTQQQKPTTMATTTTIITKTVTIHIYDSKNNETAYINDGNNDNNKQK